jgi:hypothetical protein
MIWIQRLSPALRLRFWNIFSSKMMILLDSLDSHAKAEAAHAGHITLIHRTPCGISPICPMRKRG